MRDDQRDKIPWDDPAIKRFVDFLASRQYRIQETYYSPAAFGNFYIDMCSHDLYVRLSCDRSQWMIDVRGVQSDEWFYLLNVHVMLSGSESLLESDEL